VYRYRILTRIWFPLTGRKRSYLHTYYRPPAHPCFERVNICLVKYRLSDDFLKRRLKNRLLIIWVFGLAHCSTAVKSIVRKIIVHGSTSLICDFNSEVFLVKIIPRGSTGCTFSTRNRKTTGLRTAAAELRWEQRNKHIKRRERNNDSDNQAFWKRKDRETCKINFRHFQHERE